MEYHRLAFPDRSFEAAVCFNFLFGDGCARPVQLQHFDQVRRQPDVELLKAGLEPVLELDEELAALRIVSDIHEHANQIVPIALALVPPLPADCLRLARNCPKPLLQFEQRVNNRRLGEGCPVVKS